MSKKKKDVSQVKKLFNGIKKKVRAAKIEGKRLQCECPHKSRGGKLWIKKYKKSDKKAVFKCRECGDKINFSEVVDVNANDINKLGKKICNDFMNYCNICKITLNPKYDAKYSKIIGKAQFHAYQVKKIGRVALGEIGHKRGNRRNSKKKGNFIINGGNSGLR